MSFTRASRATGSEPSAGAPFIHDGFTPIANALVDRFFAGCGQGFVRLCLVAITPPTRIVNGS